jgi:hypothetical protein
MIDTRDKVFQSLHYKSQIKIINKININIYSYMIQRARRLDTIAIVYQNK